MEENNRKGPGVFYAVVGVATLVVAIIGATFAFFTATAATDSTDDIKGTTAEAVSLGLSVSKVAPTLAVEKMVPLASDTLMETALRASCKDKNGYAACQVYKIEVTSSTVENVNVVPTVTLTDEDDTFTNLKFQLLSGTSSADFAIDTTNMALPAGDSVGTVLQSRTSKTGEGNSAVWYFVVWLEEAQAGNANESGKSYKGTVSINATDASGATVTTGELTASF